MDLDGTLILTDMLHESALAALKHQPWTTLAIPIWLMQGKAVLKKQLADRTFVDPTTLPYNQELLEWLQQQRASGRKLILCTASDHAQATGIAEHLQIFDEVLASDGTRNLAGHRKAEALVQCFGDRGFDYAGNSKADLKVWSVAAQAIVVNAPPSVAQKAKAVCTIEQSFPQPAPKFGTWLRALRVHQWLKNLLLLVPLLAAHQIAAFSAWETLALAFLAFSLCASSVYISNDLMDLDSDRQHPRKRSRPFASGLIPVSQGVIAAALLLGLALLLGYEVGESFFGWLLFYLSVTLAYTWWLKRIVLVDTLVLAALYTTRILAGAAAVGISMSFWLLAFSVFLFLSLAFVKRYAELEVQILSGKDKAHGRGYHTADAPLIQALGIASGYSSVLVLALYLNTEAVLKLYKSPEVVWGAVLILVYWISWIWLQAHRGKMHDDPLVFAVKDKESLLAGAAFALVMMLGTVGWQW